MWLGRDWFVTVNASVDVVVDDAESRYISDSFVESNGGGEIPGGVSFSALRVLEWVFTAVLCCRQHLLQCAFAELPSKESREAKPASRRNPLKIQTRTSPDPPESARTETRAWRRSATASWRASPYEQVFVDCGRRR